MKSKQVYQIVLCLALLYGKLSAYSMADTHNYKTATIKNKRGYIQVYKEPHEKSEVIGKIYSPDLITCIPDLTQNLWLIAQGGVEFPVKEDKVQKIPTFQGKGYVKRQEIVLLDTLDCIGKHKFVAGILANYQKLNKKMWAAMKKSEKLAEESTKELHKLRSICHENRYMPILPYIEELVVVYNDVPLLSQFIEVLITDEGDAEVRPSYTIGKIYEKKKQLLSQKLSELTMKNREIIIGQLRYYLMDNADKPFRKVNEWHEYHIKELARLVAGEILDK